MKQHIDPYASGAQRGNPKRQSEMGLTWPEPLRSFHVWLLVLALLLAWLSGPVGAADGRTVAAVRTPGTEANLWLARVQGAAQRLNYSGNFVYQQGSQLHSSRISHAVDQSGEHEKLEILDGKSLEYIRHNDELKCYMPDSKLVVIEKRPSGERFPGLLMSSNADIDAFYKVSRIGADRVAGRACQVTLLEPRDNMRYGYRLWTDQQTGLLLKAQTINDRGDVIEQIGFTEVTIGENIDRSRFKPNVKSWDGWRRETLDVTPAELTQSGWTLKNPVPGFQKIREVKRVFADRREVGQIVYSDGLANISVFIETNGTPSATEGDTNLGTINVVSRRHGEFWLTVVGEVPVNSIRQVASSLEFAKSVPR